MSENVTSLSGAPVTSDRRAMFLAQVAASFDNYTADSGYEPDAIVYVLGGLKQDCRGAWLLQGESQGGGTAMLALANATIVREIGI